MSTRPQEHDIKHRPGSQPDPRDAAAWLHKRYGPDTGLDLLLAAAREAGGWDEELRMIGLNYLKPTAPSGHEVSA